MPNTLPPNEEENKLIKRAYRRLLASIKEPPNERNARLLRRAYELAVEAHRLQRRKSGEPYILHPIEVARICSQEMGLDVKAIIAALLHDVVEDTEVTLKDIEQEFGLHITTIVDGLTKFEKLPDLQEEITTPQAENFKKVLLTLSRDPRTALIKLADRMHNMRTLGSMPKQKQLKIASETSFIYAPLAHRLGYYKLKSEFQDLCLKIIDPELYEHVVQKLQETKRSRDTYIRKFIKPIKKRLRKEGFKFRIFGRAKSISSIANKLRKKQVRFEEVYDLFAVRIVLDLPEKREKSACWNVYAIISESYTPIPERLKDWVSKPKSNGYESLHMTVMGPYGRFVEVQIRSERMDEIAERGYAAHWKYKGLKATAFDGWLARMRESLENPTADTLDSLSDAKANLFSDEVYVFTPKGEMRYFPLGATALDFAFDIHSEVGYHCKSVKVNQRIVPLSYRLRNGDQLLVITSNSQKPSKAWLQIVKTGKARAKIRQALKEERRELSSIGKDILARKLKSLKLNSEENIDTLVKYFKFENRIDFYYEIYQERINLNEIKELKVEQRKILLEKASEEEVQDLPEVELKIEDTGRNLNKRSGVKPRLLIQGEDASNYNYELSTCCRPVHGDDIFAYFTSKQNVKIHRTTCPNAEYLQATYGYRIKTADWMDDESNTFVADLLITGMDDMGVVQRLTSILGKLGLNMRSITMTGNEGRFEGRISVVVYNKDQLQQLVKSLKDLNEVNTVARID